MNAPVITAESLYGKATHAHKIVMETSDENVRMHYDGQRTAYLTLLSVLVEMDFILLLNILDTEYQQVAATR